MPSDLSSIETFKTSSGEKLHKFYIRSEQAKMTKDAKETSDSGNGSKKEKVNILWFRNGLRLHDNESLLKVLNFFRHLKGWSRKNVYFY